MQHAKRQHALSSRLVRRIRIPPIAHTEDKTRLINPPTKLRRLDAQHTHGIGSSAQPDSAIEFTLIDQPTENNTIYGDRKHENMHESVLQNEDSNVHSDEDCYIIEFHLPEMHTVEEKDAAPTAAVEAKTCIYRRTQE